MTFDQMKQFLKLGYLMVLSDGRGALGKRETVVRVARVQRQELLRILTSHQRLLSETLSSLKFDTRYSRRMAD